MGRTWILLTEYSVDGIIAAMRLTDVRRACHKTQVALAKSLGVNQGEISKIEHRKDVYLSTLAGYVKALGGRLEVRAVFRDRQVRISQFDRQGKGAKRSQPRRLEAGG